MVADVVSVVQGHGESDGGCDGRHGVDGTVDSFDVKIAWMITKDVNSNQHGTHCAQYVHHK